MAVGRDPGKLPTFGGQKSLCGLGVSLLYSGAIKAYHGTQNVVFLDQSSHIALGRRLAHPLDALLATALQQLL